MAVCRTLYNNLHRVPNIVEGDDAHHEPDEETEDDRITEDAPVFLNILGIPVDFLDAGDLPEHPVGGDCEGNAGAGGEVGDGDAGQTVEVLDGFGNPVTEEQRPGGSNSGGKEPQVEILAHDGDQGTDEGEVPEIPDIDIQGLGEPDEQQDHIDQDRDGDDPQPDLGGKRDGGGRRPANIHNVERGAGILDHRLTDCGQGAPHEADDQVDTDERNTDSDRGAESPAGFSAEDQSNEENDDGQHDSCPKVIKESFNCN